MGVSAFMSIWICFGHWNLFHAVSQSKYLVMDIVFQLVLVKPILLYIDTFVTENFQTVRSETICYICAFHIRGQSPDKRVDATEDIP